MNTQGQQQAKFKLMLNQFLKTRGLQERETPEYNQFTLYKIVCRRGGCQSVTNHAQWENIAKQLKAKDPTNVKSYYLKYLYLYERKNYYGCEQEDDEPLMIISNPRKMVKTDKQVGQQNTNKRIDENLSLQDEITRNLQENNKDQQLFYLHKSKLNQSKTENKRIILGLESFMNKKQAIYSLNMLLLYSVNMQFPFFLQNNEKIFQALSSYTQNLYPPKNQEQKQHLRMVVAIFRNLTMYSINLKYILKTPIFELFVKMFNTRLDPQCSKNIVDIMTGLVKVGWDCNQVINEIEQCVLDDKIQQIQNAMELLRGLMQEKQQSMINHVRDRVDTFCKLLLSPEVTVQLKEQTLQILSFVSDLNPEARSAFSKNNKFLGILINILQHMRHQEKLTQFAALTLSNISTAPGARQQLYFFETQLMSIGFTDDSLAGIVANILADVANV